MKSIITVIFSVFFLGLVSCGGGAKNNEDGTHTHDDGSVHGSHDEDKSPKPTEQESFKVEADSTTLTANPAQDHSDEAHDHGDGKTHKH